MATAAKQSAAEASPNNFKKGRKKSRWVEYIVEPLLFLCAITATLGVATIVWFIFKEGLPVFVKYGFWDFVSTAEWKPLNNQFGVFAMIVGSVLVTAGALILGVPVGIACSIYLAEFAPNWLQRIIRPAVELLAGIPSVIYGFYGLMIIVPLLKEWFGGTGLGALAASIVLAIMILPTIINISEDAIRAVPREYKEGSLAIGANHWQTVRKVILPVAKSGIIAAVVLGMGRAIGETMAVIMVAGNSVLIPDSLMDPVRTLTGNIVIEMAYASGDHSRALFATGIILFIFISILNLVTTLVMRKRGV